MEVGLSSVPENEATSTSQDVEDQTDCTPNLQDDHTTDDSTERNPVDLVETSGGHEDGSDQKNGSESSAADRSPSCSRCMRVVSRHESHGSDYYSAAQDTEYSTCSKYSTYSGPVVEEVDPSGLFVEVDSPLEPSMLDRCPQPLRHRALRQVRRRPNVKALTCRLCQKRTHYTKMKHNTRCREAYYCSIQCQRKDWKDHKRSCKVCAPTSLPNDPRGCKTKSRYNETISPALSITEVAAPKQTSFNDTGMLNRRWKPDTSMSKGRWKADTSSAIKSARKPESKDKAPAKPNVKRPTEVSAAMAKKRLRSDFKRLCENPPYGIAACPRFTTRSNLWEWDAVVIGPRDSPWEDGEFLIEMKFPTTYPFDPPSVRFVTYILHPNIDEDGYVHFGDSPERHGNHYVVMDVASFLMNVQALLDDPNLEEAANEDVANLYKTNKYQYDLLIQDIASNSRAQIETIGPGQQVMMDMLQEVELKEEVS